MTEQELDVAERVTQASLRVMVAAIPKRHRDIISVDVTLVQKAAMQGIAARYLLACLWRDIDPLSRIRFTFGDQILKLLSS